MKEVNQPTPPAITLAPSELGELLTQAAERGAALAIDALAVYHLQDAAKRLSMSYNTLKKRIAEGKIKPVDGRITGAEIRRYLMQRSR
ncbi:hypothetical protein [Bordetella sp. 2513F-2]